MAPTLPFDGVAITSSQRQISMNASHCIEGSKPTDPPPAEVEMLSCHRGLPERGTYSILLLPSERLGSRGTMSNHQRELVIRLWGSPLHRENLVKGTEDGAGDSYGIDPWNSVSWHSSTVSLYAELHRAPSKIGRGQICPECVCSLGAPIQ